MSETKKSLKELIQKQVINKYENEDLLNLAIALYINGFSDLVSTSGSFEHNYFGEGFEWKNFESRAYFEKDLRKIFSNYDEFKIKRIKKIEDIITQNTLKQLSTVQKLLESRDN